jgi:tetratricopeptide (TPR) repeat protein
MIGPSHRQLAAALLLLSVLGIGTYGRVIDNGYAFDAYYTVRDNPQVRPGVPLAEVFLAPYWTGENTEGRGLYRPLSVLSFQLTRRVWDEPLAIDHAIDLGFHVLCCLALLAFLMQMGARFGVALTLAVVFLLHPIQTEVVASLVGRTDLLATFLALLALNLALTRSIAGPLIWIGVWGLFSLSLLAKESAANLLLILPACWAARALWRGASPVEAARGAFPLVLSLGLAVVCNLVLRQIVLGDLLVTESAIQNDDALGFFELRWRALAFASLYAQKLIWPHPLLPDYLTGVISLAGFGLNIRALAAGAMILGSLAWPAWSWHRHRRLTRTHLGILLFWLAVAPVSNLIIQIGTPFGERLLYFPLIFLLLAAIDLPIWRPVSIAGLEKGPKLWPVWAALAITMGLLSAARMPEWKNNRSLFEAAARDCPANYYSQMALGATLMRDGGGPRERALTIKSFHAAAENRPDAYPPWSMLGQLAYAEGDYPTARTHFEEANDLARGREREPSLLNLSRTYRAVDEFDRLESLLVPEAGRHPEWLKLQRELGDYWLSRDRIPEALAQFERILLRDPKDETAWRIIIWAHLSLGQKEQAIERLEASPPGTVDYRFKLKLESDGLALPN